MQKYKALYRDANNAARHKYIYLKDDEDLVSTVTQGTGFISLGSFIDDQIGLHNYAKTGALETMPITYRHTVSNDDLGKPISHYDILNSRRDAIGEFDRPLPLTGSMEPPEKILTGTFENNSPANFSIMW